MTELKSYQDRARADKDEAIRLKAEIDQLANTGSDEDLQKALEMLPALEEANQKASQSEKLYNAMRETSLMEKATAAPLFVNSESQEDEGDKVMTLAAFNLMSPKQRLAFSQAGGRIEN